MQDVVFLLQFYSHAIKQFLRYLYILIQSLCN